MNASPSSLSRATLNRGNLPRFASAADEPGTAPRSWRVGRQLRAARRTLWLFLFVPPAIVVQSVLVLLPGREKARFAAFFWRVISRILGLKVRIVGVPARQNSVGPKRPVIYVCNHSSWLDIPAIGGPVTGRFVSKDDVARWPVIGTIARLGRTIYVSRSRSQTLRERDDMQQSLADGDDLFLFPEGTSSDGSRVLPFRSPFFAAAYGCAKPLIQPVSIVYDRLAGLPVGHASRAVFAWYGDMTLAPHYWALAQWRGKRVTLLFHSPLDPCDFADRKALAQTTWQIVAEGAAALRQNQAVSGLTEAVPITASGAAFA
jgi:1-acyl-sn-glycerol-3-phosphate acyltransferase